MRTCQIFNKKAKIKKKVSDNTDFLLSSPALCLLLMMWILILVLRGSCSTRTWLFLCISWWLDQSLDTENTFCWSYFCTFTFTFVTADLSIHSHPAIVWCFVIVTFLSLSFIFFNFLCEAHYLYAVFLFISFMPWHCESRTFIFLMWTARRK